MAERLGAAVNWLCEVIERLTGRRIPSGDPAPEYPPPPLGGKILDVIGFVIGLLIVLLGIFAVTGKLGLALIIIGGIVAGISLARAL